MGKAIKWLSILLFLAAIVLILLSTIWNRGAHGEEEMEEIEFQPLYVISDSLNARFRPNKKSMIINEYEFGNIIEPTGKWSEDRNWIEIHDWEFGFVWVNVNYVSERTDIYEVFTLNDKPVKVRSRPGAGKVKTHLRKNQHVKVTQTVMGYGKTIYGWIDLGYFIEECE